MIASAAWAVFGSDRMRVNTETGMASAKGKSAGKELIIKVGTKAMKRD